MLKWAVPSSTLLTTDSAVQNRKKYRAALFLLMAVSVGGLLLFPACIERAPQNVAPLEVNLYFGIENLVRLNDSEENMFLRSSAKREKKDITNPELIALHFSHYWLFKGLGVKAYFRSGRVALIEIQEPFQGTIQGKKLSLFAFGNPPGKNWEETITKDLGLPQQAVSGGRLGSNALFYSWGDLAFNGSGPNQVSLYRDASLTAYRQKNFGREVAFFPTN